MAERRMFAQSVVESDMFLDMPLSAQALYFHLGMHGDDDGFVGNPRKVQRMVGAADDDMRLLIAKGFVLAFDSGIIVLKHWKISNYIQADRYRPTLYAAEKAQLAYKKGCTYEFVSNSDTECIQSVSKLDTECIQHVSSLEECCTPSIGKVSIVKDNNTYTLIEHERMNELFNDFWTVYPRKANKQSAIKAWKKLNPDEALAQRIIQAVNAFKSSQPWQQDSGRYIPYPATFINGRRWEDETTEAIPETPRADAWAKYRDPVNLDNLYN